MTKKEKIKKSSDIENSNEFKKIEYMNKFLFLYNVINLDKYIAFDNIKKKKLKLIYVNQCIDDDKKYIKLLHYNKIKKVGSGAFGNVYYAEKNKKKYALKLQDFNKYNNFGWRKKNLNSYIDSIIKEYKIGIKLGKNHISPKVYNIYLIYNNFNKNLCSVIEMEYIKSVTLDDYERKKKLTDKEKDLLKKKIDILHKLNVYHGDLHKGNILVIKWMRK
jgi:serine/threonine protein kinase